MQGRDLRAAMEGVGGHPALRAQADGCSPVLTLGFAAMSVVTTVLCNIIAIKRMSSVLLPFCPSDAWDGVTTVLFFVVFRCDGSRSGV